MSLYWQTLSADESYVASQRSLKKSSFQKALSLANKSIKKNPREPRYYYGRAKVLLVSTVELSEEEKHIAKELAIEDLATALVINPTNLVTLRNTVPLYYYLAINDLNKITTENNTDEIYLETTKNYYQSLKHYSQTDVGIYTLLAKYENELGLIEDFEISKQNIQRLRPDLLQWYLQ
jgi:hypothetical protein